MISPTSRRYLIMFLSLTCFASVNVADGQTAAPNDTTTSHALQIRPWALEARTDRLTGPIDLMIRRRLSPKTSLRLWIDVSGRNSESANNYSYLNENASSRYTISSDIHYIRYLTPDSDLKWFVGTGPHVEYSINEQQTDRESSYTYTDSITILYKEDNSSRGSSWVTGIRVFAGIEWLISDRISIAVECGLPGQYRWSHSEGTDQKIRTNQDTGEVLEDKIRDIEKWSGNWTVGTTSTKLVFAIHFF